MQLGRRARLDALAERWIVWPAPRRAGPDPRTAELAARGIRAIGFVHADGLYAFRG